MTDTSSPRLELVDNSSLSAHSLDLSSKDQRVEAVKDVVIGSIAGMVGKVVEYPFDTVKVRLQSQPLGQVQYRGPLDCFRKSVRADGFFSLYRGLTAPMTGAAVEISSLFFSYRVAQDFLRATVCSNTTDTLPLGALVFCGAASGAFTSTLLTPIELVKCQMQVPSSSQSPRMLSVIRAVYTHHGIRGFWRGQMGTLIRETGGSAAWFGSYEAILKILKMEKAQSTEKTGESAVWQQLLAGACAGMCYNFVFYPADTVKSRMQTEEVGSGLVTKQNGFWAVGKQLWEQQGIKGMYRGCGITVARAAPSSALIFTVYENLRSLF